MTLQSGKQSTMDTTVLASDLRFPEGPIWFSDGSVVLVEIARGTLTRVSAEGDVDVVAELKGGPNDDKITGGGGPDVCEGNDEGLPNDAGDTFKSCP